MWVDLKSFDDDFDNFFFEHARKRKLVHNMSCSAPHACCPPRMADGRLFTDYRSRCDINAATENAPVDSFAYRQFLITNADTFMTRDRKRAYARGSCAPCATPYERGTMLPEKDVYKCTPNVCKYTAADENGLGVGREYAFTDEYKNELSTLRDSFVKSKEAEQASSCKLCAGAK